MPTEKCQSIKGKILLCRSDFLCAPNIIVFVSQLSHLLAVLIGQEHIGTYPSCTGLPYFPPVLIPQKVINSVMVRTEIMFPIPQSIHSRRNQDKEIDETLRQRFDRGEAQVLQSAWIDKTESQHREIHIRLGYVLKYFLHHGIRIALKIYRINLRALDLHSFLQITQLLPIKLAEDISIKGIRDLQGQNRRRQHYFRSTFDSRPSRSREEIDIYSAIPSVFH